MDLTRRQAIGAGLAALGVASFGQRAAGQTPVPAANRRRVLRVAHITDCHLQAGPGEGGLARCFQHMQSQADAPTLILNTGDTVFNADARDEAETALQWALWRRITRAENSLPMEHALGNHCFWGANRERSKTTGREPRWGTKWAVDELGMPGPYYSFDRAGWHFVSLFNTRFNDAGGYTGGLDDEQFEWLAEDLRRRPANRPTVILSHISIVSVCSFFDGNNEREGGGWTINGGAMHTDARRLMQLFREVGNVRLCLSGHKHQVDLAELYGTRYWCGGAVSGNWWNDANPAHLGFERGYSLIDLYDDGSNDIQYVEYDLGYKPA